MKRKVPIIKEYSTAFKMKVVSEIEQGKFSIDQARKIYDIGGGETIQKWMKKLGKENIISQVVRIEMKDEKRQTERVKEREADAGICFGSVTFEGFSVGILSRSG